MSLNIKNKRTTALVRELANRTGVSQTRAVEEAVEARLASLDQEAQQTSGEGTHELLMRLQNSLTEDERAALRNADDELYDQAGLPT